MEINDWSTKSLLELVFMDFNYGNDTTSNVQVLDYDLNKNKLFLSSEQYSTLLQVIAITPFENLLQEIEVNQERWKQYASSSNICHEEPPFN